jgi:hypothetical protein
MSDSAVEEARERIARREAARMSAKQRFLALPQERQAELKASVTPEPEIEHPRWFGW